MSNEGLLKVDKIDLVTEDELISDQRIRSILSKFAPILHQGILESNSFFMRSAGQKLSSAVPITNQALSLWERYYEISDKTINAARAGKLFVPAIDVSELELLMSGDFDENDSKQLAVQGSHTRKHRINLDKVIRVPVQPLDFRKLFFLVKPQAHLGGRLGNHTNQNNLYNAFIDLDVFVQDRFGRWVVDAIPGTTPGVDGPNWLEGTVYSPYNPIRTSISFNTTIKTNKSNSLKVIGENRFGMEFSCEIHHLDRIDQLDIPKDSRLRFFFWQLDTFLNNSALNRNGRFPLLEDSK